MCLCVLFFQFFFRLCLYSSFLLPRSPRFASSIVLSFCFCLSVCVFASVDFCFFSSFTLRSRCIFRLHVHSLTLSLFAVSRFAFSLLWVWLLLLYFCCFLHVCFVRLHFFLDSLIYRRLSTLKFLTCFSSSFLLIDFACFVFFFVKFIMFQSIVFSKYFVLD